MSTRTISSSNTSLPLPLAPLEITEYPACGERERRSGLALQPWGDQARLSHHIVKVN